MFNYELFLYKGQPYCHWVSDVDGHGVNLLEGGRGFFWSSFPCVGMKMYNILCDREHWEMLPLFHTLAWRHFGVGYYLAFTSESCSDTELIAPDRFKTIFYKSLKFMGGSMYIDHLGQFRNYEGVIHFDKVEHYEDDPVFWLDGLTAEVVKDMLS